MLVKFKLKSTFNLIIKIILIKYDLRKLRSVFNVKQVIDTFLYLQEVPLYTFSLKKNYSRYVILITS